MKTLRIEQVVIKDWCIFDNLVVDIKNVHEVSGDNETGKSRFGSAITWVLNGTDIDGNTLVDVIPVHREQSLSPSVKLEMTITNSESGLNRPVTIEKIYKAKVNRTKEYTGEHEVVMMLNGVKVPGKDFDKFITENLCNMELFNMLSNVSVFTEKLKTKGKELPWQLQRRIITSLITQLMTEKQEISTSEKYKDLQDGMLRHGNLVDYLKQLKSKLSDIETDIEEFAPRLDTLMNQIDESLDSTEDDIKKEISSKQEQLTMLEKNNRSCREKQIEQFNTTQNKKVDDIHSVIEQAELEFSQEETKRNNTISDYKEKLSSDKLRHNACTIEFENMKKELEKLEQIVIAESCITCGAALDKENVKQQKNSIKEKVDALKNKIETKRTELNTIAGEYNSTNEQLKSFMSIKLEMPQVVKDGKDKIAQIRSEKMPTIEDMQGYKEEKENIALEIDVLRTDLLKAHNNRSYKEQVEQLKLFNKNNQKEFSQIQRLIDLCKDFTMDRCKNIEQQANDLFSGTGIHFQLFKHIKTTDEHKETFEIYYNGKEYNKQLSLSTKKLVSYWITQALQKAYQVQVPIIMDNMESVAFDRAMIEHQAILITRTVEQCPECGLNRSRRSLDGTWTCECGNVWKKTLTV